MELYIKEQSIYLKDVKGKKTKKGNTYVTALGAFLSSYKNENEEKVNEPALNVVVNCYNEKAFNALRSVKEKAGFITVSGKLQTNSYQKEDGTWVNQIELIVLSASIPTQEEKSVAPAAADEEVPF